MSAPTVAARGAQQHQPGHYGTYPQRRPASSSGAGTGTGTGAGTPRSFHYQHQQQQQTQPQQQQPPPQQQPSQPRTASDFGRTDSPTPAAPLKRPRRLSNSNMAGGSSIPVAVSSTSPPQGPPVRNGPPPRPPQAFGPPSLRPRSSSWGSTSPAAQAANNWRLNAYRSTPRLASELFAVLPGEVMDLILAELKDLHLGARGESCATCWMRDLCSLSLACKQWLGHVRAALYTDIQIIGLDSLAQKKKFNKLAQGSRVLLLRRTLRSSPQLAALVRSLKVPSPLPATAPRVLDEYLDLVASVVMACPNLESLVGLAPRYNHQYSRLFHALGTRRELRQMEWFLDAPPPPQKKTSSRGKASPPSMVPADLQPSEATAFLDLHLSWAHLTSFTLHCQPNAPIMSSSLIATTLSRLPALEHLHLSHVPAMSFTDANLLGLPASLHSLSLSHTPGVTPAGLSAFATQSASRQTLVNLTLRHVRLDSLGGLARILSNLTRLETLSVVLANPPTLDDDTFIWLMPYLASPTLEKLHWDMTSQAATPTPSGADSILARSIAANGFPSLRQLRVLNDPDGAFQSLCRPVERIDIASDRHHLAHATNSPSTLSPASIQMATPTSSLFSPLSPPNSPDSMVEPTTAVVETTNLVQARRAAQARLEAAHYRPRFVVNVVDHSEEPDDNTSIIDSSGSGGVLVDKFNVGGFIGTIGSAITYHLLPDPHGGSEARGGLVQVEDLMVPGAGGEDLGTTSNTPACAGRWNSGVSGAAFGGAGAHYEKSSKQGRWWHTERTRWAPVRIS